ncbi:F-box associated domain-containing protein [Caenorhabditis elegans]|uniref:F-box associated domain-containing protein n=1 Tax=Caenorhabditis elegans TaxID=6239 RepID=O17774_CAEEL|nr:F-box associated domain-containing protein [Caenorhabditis elegans]CAB07181.3 F-box associated domain-containing protein [Caenorhabditis elegans]|eukprot:NP_493495.2 F-box B protein [Caenorhabditis elegans]
MTTSTSFPILLLPPKCLQHALKEMKHMDFIYFSFASKQCMNLAITVNSKATRLEVKCTHSCKKHTPHCIMVEAKFMDNKSAGFWIYTDITTGGDRDCSETMSPLDGKYYGHGRWRVAEKYRKMPKITLRKLIEHLLVLLHLPKIHVLSFKNMSDLQSINEIFKGFPIGLFSASASKMDYNECMFYDRVLQLFSDNTERFSIEYSERFISRHEIHDLLARDLHRIVFLDWRPYLLQAINSNCERIVLECYVESQLLNKFLKHWMRGSNPRMKYLQAKVDIKNQKYKSQILEGIETLPLKNRTSIESFDGKKARINLMNDGLFLMYVRI